MAVYVCPYFPNGICPYGPSCSTFHRHLVPLGCPDGLEIRWCPFESARRSCPRGPFCYDIHADDHVGPPFSPPPPFRPPLPHFHLLLAQSLFRPPPPQHPLPTLPHFLAPLGHPPHVTQTPFYRPPSAVVPLPPLAFVPQATLPPQATRPRLAVVPLPPLTFAPQATLPSPPLAFAPQAPLPPPPRVVDDWQLVMEGYHSDIPYRTGRQHSRWGPQSPPH